MLRAAKKSFVVIYTGVWVLQKKSPELTPFRPILSNFAAQPYFMIDALISSKTRIKLLLKFFLNSNATAYLRSLESEFGESTNGIRVELNRLEGAGLLISEAEGNKKIFRANTTHPLFREIHNIMLKHIGLDQVVENVVRRLGAVQFVYLVGDFSKGIDSQVIDLILIGDFDTSYLAALVEKAEKLVGRKIRYLLYSNIESASIDWTEFEPSPLLLWSNHQPTHTENIEGRGI